MRAGTAWLQWPVRVEIAQSMRGPAIEAVYATGIVEPTVMVPVAPRTGGRLAAINVEEGAQVRRGQVLARIESADLDQTVQEMVAREQLARTPNAPATWWLRTSSRRRNSTAHGQSSRLRKPP
jgi:multidrug efflux pump subunit AcrA (membrane-fusion protein)